MRSGKVIAARQTRRRLMGAAEQRSRAKSFLKKAEEYLASAEDNLELERYTPAAGDAIHAGINAKDAIVTALTGSTSKGKDHATAAKELARALAMRPQATAAERGLRELISAKGDEQELVGMYDVDISGRQGGLSTQASSRTAYTGHASFERASARAAS